MLLLSQLDQIPHRFPAYVREMRGFLESQDFAVRGPESLVALWERLQAEADTRRDVAALVGAMARRERERSSSMDLLGIVVVAATGTQTDDFDSPLLEETVRGLLRFVSQARRAAFDEAGPVVARAAMVRPVQAEPVAPVARPVQREPVRVAAVAAAPMLLRAEVEDEVETESEPRRRGYLWAVVGIVCVALGLGGVWMVHHRPEETVSAPAGAGAVLERSPVAAPPSSVVAPSRSGAATSARPAARGRVTVRMGADVEALRGPVIAKRKMEAAPVVRVPAPSMPARGADALARLRTPPPAVVERRAGKEGAAAARVDPYARPGLLRRVPGGEVAEVPEPEERKTAEGGVVRPATIGMMAGHVIYSPAPLYPEEASKNGVQGEVTVRAVVNEEGNVTDARVISGPEPLRGAALEAVQHWRFEPYKENGKRIAMATTAIVDFQLPSP